METHKSEMSHEHILHMLIHSNFSNNMWGHTRIQYTHRHTSWKHSFYIPEMESIKHVPSLICEPEDLVHTHSISSEESTINPAACSVRLLYHLSLALCCIQQLCTKSLVCKFCASTTPATLWPIDFNSVAPKGFLAFLWALLLTLSL